MPTEEASDLGTTFQRLVELLEHPIVPLLYHRPQVRYNYRYRASAIHITFGLAHDLPPPAKTVDQYKMSDDLTPLSLPTTLPYPITLTRLHAQQGQSILRGAPLISYTFTSSTNARELARLEKGLPPTEGIRIEDVRQGDMSATWECGLDGEFVKFESGIEVGRVVERKHAS